MKDYIVSLKEVLRGRNKDFDVAMDKNEVMLVRQADHRNEMYIHGVKFENFSLYELYKHDKQNFLYYQGEQNNRKFDKSRYVVSFLSEKSTTARLVGVFKNNGLTGKQYPNGPEYNYDFTEAEGFDILKERIIIDWGKGTSNYTHYINTDKKVIRIEAGMEYEEGLPSFSSYADVNVTLSQLRLIVEKNLSDWKSALQSVNCIYIITDHKNGKHYIGSTYSIPKISKGGMWERWIGYAKNGHNNNKSLKEAMEADPNYENNYSWAILETLPLNIAPHDAVIRENLYKEKFLTRKFGYNDN